MTIPETDGYRRIKQTALNAVRSLKLDDGHPATYAKVTGGGENFYGSYHATQILDLFGELEKLPPATIDAWAAYFHAMQQPDGAFRVDQQPTRPSAVLPHLDPIWHSTRGLLWSLRTLDRKPLHDLTFMEPLLNARTLYDWTKGFDWSASWTVGNQILACATALFALRDWFGVADVDRLMEEGMYPALEELMDPQTGYFGTQFGAPLWNGLFGTIHITPIYFAQGWPLPYPERNVDSTIACQHADGSYWEGGSNCPDFDGAYMLANLAEITDYRREDVEAAARRYLDHALMHEDSAGRGWRAKRRDWNPAPAAGDDGYVGDRANQGAADATFGMLDSWFYPLSIALVAHLLGDSGYEGPYRLNPHSLHECNVTPFYVPAKA